MICGPVGLSIIREFEGCRLEAYPDQGGIWTIGWGKTAPWIVEGLTCTQEQADNWLIQDVAAVSGAVTRMIEGAALSNNQFSAIVSLTYNIGSGAFASSSALALIKAGSFGEVPAHMRLWDKVDGIVDAGLVRRRNMECILFNTLDAA